MPRKRFNTAEKQLIASGVPIEWQNVTQWHPATITDKTIVTEDGGWQHIVGTNERATRTTSKGQVIWISPGHIREANKATTCKKCRCPIEPVPGHPGEWVVMGTGTTADGLSYCPPNPDAGKVGSHQPK